MIILYLLNTLFVLGIVLALWFPAETRRILTRLGLWDWIQGIDREVFSRWVERAGIFLMIAALALFVSIAMGGHPWDWILPAGEGLFFGVALWLAGFWSRPKS